MNIKTLLFISCMLSCSFALGQSTYRSSEEISSLNFATAQIAYGNYTLVENSSRDYISSARKLTDFLEYLDKHAPLAERIRVESMNKENSQYKITVLYNRPNGKHKHATLYCDRQNQGELEYLGHLCFLKLFSYQGEVINIQFQTIQDLYRAIFEKGLLGAKDTWKQTKNYFDPGRVEYTVKKIIGKRLYCSAIYDRSARYTTKIRCRYYFDATTKGVFPAL